MTKDEQIAHLLWENAKLRSDNLALLQRTESLESKVSHNY